MKSPIPYIYRVQRRPAPARNRWSLAVVAANGHANRLASYATRAQAVAAANVLAGWRGQVEVRP